MWRPVPLRVRRLPANAVTDELTERPAPLFATRPWAQAAALHYEGEEGEGAKQAEEGEEGELPDSVVMGGVIYHADGTSAIHFEGGESAALARLQHYLWDADCLGRCAGTK